MKLDEAGRVFQVGLPAQKRGAPEPWERARAFDKPGTDRSFLRGYHGGGAHGKGKYFGLEYADEGDYISVIVVRDDVELTYGNRKKDPNDEYNGINVLFFPNGKISADTYDPQSKRQWLADKDKIIAAAKAALKDKDLPGQYDGLGGKEVKRGTGKLSFDTDDHQLDDNPKMHRHHSDEQGKAKKYEALTFKQFLLAEGKKSKEDKFHDERVNFVEGWCEMDLEDYAHIEEAEEAFWDAVNSDPERKAEAKRIGLTKGIAYDIIWQCADKMGLHDDHLDEGKKGKFGVKLGGVYEEKPEVGFEDRLNYEKAKSECKEAGIKFKTTSNFGIHYIIFDSVADQKKAVRLIKKVIDKSTESEW